MRRVRPWLALAGWWPLSALAHSPLSSSGQEQVAAGLSLLVIGGLWGLYGLGSRRTRPARWRFWLFQLTAVLTLLTVLGPLDDWAEESTSAHMIQHMLMMVVIAPLFVVSRPLPQYYAVSGRAARAVWRGVLAITRSPMLCASLHGLVIWFWHLPPFYLLALENPWWHFFEHACFLLTALWFWWAALHGSTRGAPLALLALLFTLMHTGFLGALMTFSSSPWYPGETRDLVDQQLAGVIMWVMGGIPYIVGASWAGHRWYFRLERQMIHADRM